MKGKLKGHHGDLGISNKLYDYSIVYEYNNNIFNLNVRVHNYTDALLSFEKRCNSLNCKLIDIIKSFN